MPVLSIPTGIQWKYPVLYECQNFVFVLWKRHLERIRLIPAPFVFWKQIFIWINIISLRTPHLFPLLLYLLSYATYFLQLLIWYSNYVYKYSTYTIVFPSHFSWFLTFQGHLLKNWNLRYLTINQHLHPWPPLAKKVTFISKQSSHHNSHRFPHFYLRAIRNAVAS